MQTGTRSRSSMSLTAAVGARSAAGLTVLAWRRRLEGPMYRRIVIHFLIYSRTAPAAEDSEHDPGLDEKHWSYMDRFADRMTARGPTLGNGRESWTGSLHVVDLPDAAAARDFITREPYNQAGLFQEHFISRFANVLGRTMWQFASAADEPRFFVLAHASDDSTKDLRPVPVADLPPQLRERLIVYGELREPDNGNLAGVALALQAPTREAVEALLSDPRAVLTGYGECRDPRLGIRRSSVKLGVSLHAGRVAGSRRAPHRGAACDRARQVKVPRWGHPALARSAPPAPSLRKRSR